MPLVATTNSIITSTPNLFAWYKADAITGKNDGDALTSWVDSSGNGWNATTTGDSTSWTAPIFKTNIQNGLPVVRFASGNNGLTTSNIGAHLATPTIIALCKPSTVSMWEAIICREGISTYSFALFYNGNLAAMRLEYYINSSTSVSQILTLTNVATNKLAITSAQNDGTQTLIRYTDITSQIIQQQAISSGGAIYTGSGRGLTIGNRNNSTQLPFIGDIYEILVYDRVLTHTEILRIERSLKAKYNFIL
jgi:hypothetical protein